MMRLSHVIALAVFVGCATPAILLPADNGQSAEYPCGVGWYVCPAETKHPRHCCAEGETCGGMQPGVFETCAPGMCCDARDSTSRWGAKKAPTRQREERQP